MCNPVWFVHILVMFGGYIAPTTTVALLVAVLRHVHTYVSCHYHYSVITTTRIAEQ